MTRILPAVEHGDWHAASRLLLLGCEELRKRAAHRKTWEQGGQTLQATTWVFACSEATQDR